MPGYDKSAIVGMEEQDLDEFICGICQEIFREPVVTHCCRQTYCKACIEEWLSTHTTCPNDREALTLEDLIQAPRFAFNFVNKMRIKCDYEEKGCRVVTTIGELSQHLESCDHKPDSNCKTCGVLKVEGQPHDCLANLIKTNNSILDELDRLRQENNLFKNGSSAILESARISINNFVIERKIDLTLEQEHFLIDQCKRAILTQNNYWNICQYLYKVINRSTLFERDVKYWQVVAFCKGCGESAACCERFLRIQFGKLIIKLFIVPLRIE